jgi:hypothetical protein
VRTVPGEPGGSPDATDPAADVDPAAPTERTTGARTDAGATGSPAGSDDSSGAASGSDGMTTTGSGTGAADPGGDASGAATEERGAGRFPVLTRDTARPEGGGRAASGDAPAPARQWPVLAVLSTGAFGLLLTAFDFFRVGTLLVGLALVAGAVLRWTLPSVGMLAVRSRFTDMVTYGALGLAITLLAMMAQPHPWLVIPFLDDTLHYTIS